MINFFNRKKNKELFIKFVSGNLTEKEKTNLEILLQNEENKKEFEEINSLWKISLPDESDNHVDIDTEWALLQNRINTEGKKRENVSGFSKEKLSQKKAAYWKPAFAAVVVLLIIAALFIFNRKEEIKYQIISTVNKEIKEVKLPDGSIVNLNSASSLTFPENFKGEIREVKLKGEAFFSVAKDDKPFIISTGNASVTVLGTKFNVYVRDKKTEVFVKEGSVSFAQKNIPLNDVVLRTSEFSRIIDKEEPSPPVKNDPEIFLDWLEGKLVFRQAQLKEVIAELERYYDIKIHLTSDVNNIHTISGTFEERNIDKVLDMICLAAGLSYTKNGNNYLVTIKK